MSVIKKNIVKYALSALLVLLISFIYGLFSHHVYSIFMSYAFIIPLVGLFLSLISNKLTYQNILASSILTLTLTSLLQGVVIIAGTSTIYTLFLLIMGLCLLIMAFLSLLKLC